MVRINIKVKRHSNRNNPKRNTKKKKKGELENRIKERSISDREDKCTSMA